MKGLILAGGHGTRLRPLTHTGPKQLIPIANKPNILYCLEDLREAGITDIGVILGDNMPEKVRELLGDGSKYSTKVTYIVQGEPKGIAHAVGLSEKFMGNEPFAVYLGDNILKNGIVDLVDGFSSSDYDAMVGLCKVEEPERFGVAELDSDGNLLRLVEKPKEPKSNLALIGIYLFRRPVFDAIRTLKPSWRNELEITEAIDRLITWKGHKVKAHIVTGWWKDTGRPEDILEANRLVLDDIEPYNYGTLDKSASVAGRVAIGKGTAVKEKSVIRGPCVIGEDCVIGPNAYIGPYTSIGDRCTIEDGYVESSIVMDGTRITCKKRIVDSLIGAHSSVLSADDNLPHGFKLVIGEYSTLSL